MHKNCILSLPAVERFLNQKRRIMKQENNSKVYLDQNELNTLVKEVKETVAADVKLKNEIEHIFSAADLWNIQRMRRNTQRRSTLWN
jgi:hypothetical protein